MLRIPQCLNNRLVDGGKAASPTYVNLYRGHTQRFELSHNVEKQCKFDAYGTVVPNTATVTAPVVEIKMATSKVQSALVVCSKEISH
jgi:hypothetical protein